MDDLVFPDPHEPIAIVKAVDNNSDNLCGKRTTDSFSQEIIAELASDFHHSVLRLNQCSRNLVNDSCGPNVLFMSTNDGGFPRTGLTIVGNGECSEFPELNFVDLVLDKQRLEHGLLSIFSHELGHVMMMNVWKDFPESKSVKQHVSMGITDYAMAFFEGFGVHFQRFAHEQTEKYRLMFEQSFQYDHLNQFWHSAVDKELRINHVLHNRYIHKKLLPKIDSTSYDKEELLFLEHTYPCFDPIKLKNAQQMLSCEGVIATLFYRINSNQTIMNNYQNRDFYNKFLLSKSCEETEPEQIFTPFENVILKNLYAFNYLGINKSESNNLFIEFVKVWCKLFPEDKEELLRIFLLTTVCRSVNNDLAEIFEKMSFYGLIGNIDSFIEYTDVFSTEFKKILQAVMNDIGLLEQNIGPELWIKCQDFEVSTCLFDDSEKKPLRININTASEYDFWCFTGINKEIAKEIINAREQRGFFVSFDELYQKCGCPVF